MFEIGSTISEDGYENAPVGTTCSSGPDTYTKGVSGDWYASHPSPFQGGITGIYASKDLHAPRPVIAHVHIEGRVCCAERAGDDDAAGGSDTLLLAAFDLLGDGNGYDLDVNAEYTRAIVELVGDVLGLSREGGSHDIIKAIRGAGETRALKAAVGKVDRTAGADTESEIGALQEALELALARWPEVS